MKKNLFSVLLALVLALSLCLVTAAPVAAVSPQFLDVVADDVTTGEWVTTVEVTTPQAGPHSYHVVIADGGIMGLQIIHKYIYGPTGVGTMKLTDLNTMTFWEYVVSPGGTNDIGAGIILYMDMDADGVWIWENDAQIILESPYNDPLVTENLDTWMLRNIDNFAGFQKGAGALGGQYTGVDGTTPQNDPLVDWQTSSGYASLPVLWIGIVAGWGDYSGYDGYFDDFIINGDTYYLEPATGDSEIDAEVAGVTSVSPASGDINTTPTVTITGGGFTDATAVSFSGLGITVDTYMVDSDTQITAQLSIAADAAAGARDVTVTVPEGDIIGPGLFSIIESLTLTAPSNISLGLMVPGSATSGQSATDGTVVTNVATWAVDAADMKVGNTGFMVTAGGDPLLNLFDISDDGSIYTDALTGISYTDVKVLPFYVRQDVMPTDPIGSYAITITFTATY